MLNFQTDYDEGTGEQVLTCFLLPQMEYQAENLGKTTWISINAFQWWLGFFICSIYAFT